MVEPPRNETKKFTYADRLYTLNAEGHYDGPTIYVKDEPVPVSVLPGLVIDLGRVFAEGR